MRKILLTTMLLTIGQGIQAQTWIWYPGDMDIWTGNRINNLRTENGSFYPAFWRADSHSQTVEFQKVVDLAMPEDVEIAAEGQYGIRIDNHNYIFGMPKTFTVPYGDVYPHYWSAISAAAYHYYAKATGIMDYQQRAENIVRGNLSLFREDGRATCAFVFPRRVNGELAHYADAYANDQDWALLFYMLVNEK